MKRWPLARTCGAPADPAKTPRLASPPGRPATGACVRRAGRLRPCARHARRRALQLQHEPRTFDLEQAVHVGEARLHEHEASLHEIVAVAYLLAHHVLWARKVAARKQLNKLVLHVLDEVEPGLAGVLHHEHREVDVWLPDAVVDHAQQHGRVVREVHHELLRLLHRLEFVGIHVVRIVEEEVALAAEFHAHPGQRAAVSLDQNLYPHSFQSTDLCWAGHVGPRPDLKGCLTLVKHLQAINKAGVHCLN
mmetsp:Transcript_3922/g.11186  ORF Transcript_3922/g.11186 Transcript_3922/m.11186 type:complete len:249 (-) Transcript_3922:510-1256(-)